LRRRLVADAVAWVQERSRKYYRADANRDHWASRTTRSIAPSWWSKKVGSTTWSPSGSREEAVRTPSFSIPRVWSHGAWSACPRLKDGSPFSSLMSVRTTG
jgi:hypothetical protein